MKPLTYLLITFLSTSSIFSLAQCADLSGMGNGKLHFKVNGDRNYKNYPTTYKIKVFVGKTELKEKRIHLKKGSADTAFMKLDVANKGNYCLKIFRNSVLNIIYKKIGWEKPAAGTSINNDQVTYYVSTSKNNILLFTKVVSKDGTSGDGVKVVIE
jgi:hypothetical protein